MKKTFFFTNVATITLIAPQKISLQKLKNAFSLIQRADKKEYRKLASRLKIIFVTNRHGYTNEFFMPEKIWFANKSLVEDSDIAWLASLIIHEAFHATQFKKGKYTLPLAQLEPAALALQMKFLEKAGDQKGSDGVQRAKRERYWAKMRNDNVSSRHFRALLHLFLQNKLMLKAVK